MMFVAKLRAGIVSAAVLLAFASGCSSEVGEDNGVTSSALAVRGVVCLVPVDVNGDGIGDVMRPSSFVVTDAAACRSRYGGAIAGGFSRLDADTLSLGPTLKLQTAGGGGGPTYAAGSGIPAPVAAAVAAADIPGKHKYGPGYDCKHFSRDLEIYLQNEGFDATYTIIYAGVGAQRYGHAIVDVHIDGVAWWIEPQNGLPFELDADGDGDVETTKRGGVLGGNTEGTTSIEVFGSYAEMVATYPAWK